MPASCKYTVDSSLTNAARQFHSDSDIEIVVQNFHAARASKDSKILIAASL